MEESNRSRDEWRSVFELAFVKVAVMLNPGDAQPLHARPIDSALPRSEFLEAERIAFEHLVDRQQPAIHRRDHFRLAPHHR